MPTGAKGQKCPAKAIGCAVKIAQLATGEVDDEGAMTESGVLRV
tara:strand:- start:12 stop:143 length:132 start_codon:yes stop_codon:yes gene_type:complete